MFNVAMNMRRENTPLWLRISQSPGGGPIAWRRPNCLEAARLPGGSLITWRQPECLEAATAVGQLLTARQKRVADCTTNKAHKTNDASS